MPDTFIGVEALVARHAEQVLAFAQWAQARDWDAFHTNHYDWWAFPVNRRSSFGDQYKVTPEALHALRADSVFLARWQEGVALVCLSWGWLITQQQYVAQPDPGQRWAHWPVRLYKMALSAQLLGCGETYRSLCNLAKDLSCQGEVFAYNGRDLSWVFRAGTEPTA